MAAPHWSTWLMEQYRWLGNYHSDTCPDECAIHTAYPEIHVASYPVLETDNEYDPTDGTGLYLEDCE